MKQNLRFQLTVWVTLLMILLLISGLSSVTVAAFRVSSLELVGDAFGMLSYEALLRMVLLLGLPLLIIIGLLLSPVLRSRNIMLGLLGLGLLLLIFMWVTTKTRDIGQIELEPTAQAIIAAEEDAEEETPPVQPFPAIEPVSRIPKWVTTAVNILMMLFAFAIISFFVWTFWPEKERVMTPLFEISQEAEGALIELRNGADLRNVVLRCYIEMGRIVAEWRGIQRTQSMTPREFELSLADLGLPKEPVINLTRLFEKVRYGASKPTKADEDNAESSLTAILQACQENT